MTRKILAVMVATLATIAALVVPISATDTESNTAALWWSSSSSAFPLRWSETIADVADVKCYLAPEPTREGYGSYNAVDTVFDAMEYGRFGDGVANYRVKLVTVHVWTGTSWRDITNQPLQDIAGEGYTAATTLLGSFYYWDEMLNGSNNTSTDDVYRYGDFFAEGYNMRTSRSPSYSLVSRENPFCVRWVGYDNGGGNETAFAYFGNCYQYGTSEAAPSIPLLYLGSTHPAQISSASGGGVSQDEYDRVVADRDELQATFDEAVSDYESQITALDNEVRGWQRAYGLLESEIEAKEESAYGRGFADGNSAAGIGLDTSTPSSAILSTFAVIFRAVRDGVTPFLSVEFAGVSLMSVIGALAIVLVVALVVFVIFKMAR